MWHENNEFSIKGTRLQCLRFYGELSVPRLVFNQMLHCFMSSSYF